MGFNFNNDGTKATFVDDTLNFCRPWLAAAAAEC
jgi:hypothetical protein